MNGPDFHRLKTMVKISIEQNLRIKKFEARNGRNEGNAMVKNPATKQRGLDIGGDGKPTGSVPEETITVSATISICVEKQQSIPSRSSSTRQNGRNASRTRSPRGKSPNGRMSRWPCKDYLRGTCTNSFCENWHPPECLCSTRPRVVANFGKKFSYAHRQVDKHPCKRSK